MPDEEIKNIAVLCNVIAGAGKAVSLAEMISAALSSRGIHHQLFKVEWPEAFHSFTDVFIVGGDGTLNYFINHYPGIHLPLAIFDGGTGNDFHWLLFGKMPFAEQLDRALYSTPQQMDIGQCNDRYFINGLGIGFEGAVAKAFTAQQKKPGKTSYLFTILKNIATYRSRRYTIAAEGQIISGKKLLVDITNGRRAGGGFHIAPAAKADDGLLEVIIAEAISPMKRLWYLPVIERGKHLHLKIIQHFQTNHIVVSSETTLQYHLDGEYGEADQLTISLLPGALQFRF